MSQANASARSRRAFNPSTQSQPQPQLQTNSQNTGVTSPGLTLPQVISIIDSRLINLESFMKETKNKSVDTSVVFNQIANQEPSVLNNNTIDEFNHRFNVLVEEIETLKDIVLKLQSYTMDVNKTLYEERIQVFSDLGESIPSTTNTVNINTTIEDGTVDETIEETDN